MNAFDQANLVEAKGMAILLPFLEENAEGKVVITNKGRLAKYLQETAGDFITQIKGVMWTIEAKFEQDYSPGTKNLFLETWSNKNLDSLESHSERGCNPGWLVKTKADLLFYYILKHDDLYIIDLFRLKRWAFGFTDSNGNLVQPEIFKGKERKQRKYSQLNDTWGYAVSANYLLQKSWCKHVHVKQIPLFDEAA